MPLTPDKMVLPDPLTTTFFARFDCAPQGRQQMGRDISQPGINGTAIRKEEKRAKPFPGRTIVFVPATSGVADNAAAVRAVYDDFVGRVVNLTIQGVEYPNIYVWSCDVQQHTPTVASFFGPQPDGTDLIDDAYIVTADWLFQYAGAVS